MAVRTAGPSWRVATPVATPSGSRIVLKARGQRGKEDGEPLEQEA